MRDEIGEKKTIKIGSKTKTNSDKKKGDQIWHENKSKSIIEGWN